MIVRTAEEARAWRAQLEKVLPAVPDYEEWVPKDIKSGLMEEFG